MKLNVTKEIGLVIMDDSVSTRVQLEYFAKEYAPNFKVISVANGEEGLRELKETNLDIRLFIIDYNMGGMNGIEVIEKLKMDYDPSSFILLTANIQDRILEAAEKIQLKVIPKPMTKKIFQNLLKEQNIL